MTRQTSGLPHRSYSQYKTFTECGEKYRLERVVRAPSTPAIWFAAGTALHGVAEELDNHLHYGGDGMELDAGNCFLDYFDSEVAEDEEKSGMSRHSFRYGRGWGYDRWVKEGPRIALDYQDWRLAREGQHLEPYILESGHPLIEFELNPVFGGVTVKTIPDKVAVNTATGEALVIDYKSGSTMPDDGGMQLAAQAAAVEQVLGLEVKWGAYYQFRKGQLTDLKPLHHWTPDRLGQAFAAMDAAERAGIYMQRLSKDCDRCDVRRWCVYQGGERHPSDQG